MKLSVEELKSAAVKAIEIFPDYDMAEEILIDAIKQTAGELKWDTIKEDREQKDEVLRDVYRALKEAFKLELIDDRFTREDLDILKHAVDDLERSKSNPTGYAIEDVNRAIAHIKTAMQR